MTISVASWGIEKYYSLCSIDKLASLAPKVFKSCLMPSEVATNAVDLIPGTNRANWIDKYPNPGSC